MGIGVTPHQPTVTLGEQIQFVAIGYYADQSTRDITDVVTWESSITSVITVSSSLDQEGLGSTEGAGDALVRASFYDLYSNEVQVIVTDASVTALELQPAAVELHVGEEVQLTAEATFTDGSRGNVSGTVRWVTGDGTIATVDPTGKVAAAGLGSVGIRAIYEQPAGDFEAEPASIDVLDETVTIDGPDVRVVGLNVVGSGETATYTVELKNSGGGPASGFWVDVWLNRTEAPPAPPTSGDAYYFVDLLGASETQEIPIEVPGVGPGNYQSWVLVDSFASLDEGTLGENNNTWGPEAVSLSGDSGPAGADVAITYLQAYIQQSQAQVLYIVDVTNNGDEASAPFQVGVFSDPSFPPVAPAIPDEQEQVGSLEPGDTAYLSIAVRAIPTGFWQSYVLADVGGVLPEPNEFNNLAGFQVAP